jgi:hypothetical protein
LHAKLESLAIWKTSHQLSHDQTQWSTTRPIWTWVTVQGG